MCGIIPLAEAAQRPRRDKLAMNDDRLPFDLPAVPRKKVSAAFDGGRITSDGGVMLLAQAERRLGIADRLAREIPVSSTSCRGQLGSPAADSFHWPQRPIRIQAV